MSLQLAEAVGSFFYFNKKQRRGRYYETNEGRLFMEQRTREWRLLIDGILQDNIRAEVIPLLDCCHYLLGSRYHPLFLFFIEACIVETIGKYLLSFNPLPKYGAVALEVMTLLTRKLDNNDFETFVKKAELIVQCRALYERRFLYERR